MMLHIQDQSYGCIAIDNIDITQGRTISRLHPTVHALSFLSPKSTKPTPPILSWYSIGNPVIITTMAMSSSMKVRSWPLF